MKVKESKVPNLVAGWIMSPKQEREGRRSTFGMVGGEGSVP